MLSKLFENNQIGSMELKNRIVMTAIHLGYADEAGNVTDRLIDFYEERARGGVGLIIVGICYTEPLGHSYPHQLAIDRDDVIPKMRELTAAVHKHGAKICCQIGHGGRYCHPMIIGADPVAPSPIPSQLFAQGAIPKELSISEVAKIIYNFAEAARRAKEAGFDGVELAASGGVLIGQFLSNLTNKRTDRYGGDLLNRLTFLLKIIEAIKGKVGTDYPLLVRICGHDMVPGSHTLKEQVLVAKEIESAGVDCINVNVGWEESPFPMLQMCVPRGVFMFMAEKIKRTVRIPVIGGVRINDPLLAEEILQEGKADLITMCRPLIADPELPKKAQEGRLDDIRICLGCNQGCLDNLVKQSQTGVSCLVNVQVGREKELSLHKAPKVKKVMVIGGGPAGLEAARVAAVRGHVVHLFEKDNKLGGLLNLAAIPPGKEELMSVPCYYSTQLKKLGVEIHLQQEVTPEFIEKEKPDVLVIATGSRPSSPSIPGIQGENVANAEDILLERIKSGPSIIIVGGGATGCETAHFLAIKGGIESEKAVFLASSGILPAEEAIALTRGNRSITVLEMLPKAGTGIGPSSRFILLKDLKRLGVNIITDAKVREITSEGVSYIKNGKTEIQKADTIINALGYKPDQDLYRSVREKAPEVYIIGDCKEPRRALEAIAEGFFTGKAI